jgi:hypothetical protein
MEKKKAHKQDSFAHADAAGSMPVYAKGPLFQNSEALKELTLSISQGPVPNWVSVLVYGAVPLHHISYILNTVGSFSVRPMCCIRPGLLVR